MTARATSLPGWSDWQPVAGMSAISADVLAETLDGGQAFRWNRVEAGANHSTAAAPIWEGLWADNIVRLRIDANDHVEWSAPDSIHTQIGRNLGNYLGLDRDFAVLADTLPWRSDPHLARCLVSFSGLRILRQPLGETLLGFLCSATKQIVQIKQMIALLARRHGAPILPAMAPHADGGASAALAYHRLPTWPELATVPERELRHCLLGFRARFIAETSRFLARHRGWLDETAAMPYPAAKARLCELPGVGGKVADCVLLFGAGRLEAFPVDVWILKTMARRYELEGWKPAQLAAFGRVHFGPLAGLAQQYLFAWERRHGKTEPI